MSELKHAHSIMDYIIKRNRVYKLIRLHQLPDGPAKEVIEFQKTLESALEAAETDDDKKYGPFFQPLFELAYNLEVFNTKR